MQRYRIFAASFLICFTAATALAEDIIIPAGKATIIFHDTLNEPLTRAVDALADDFEKVTGHRPPINGSTDGTVLIYIVNGETAGNRRELKPLEGFEAHRVYAGEDGNSVYLHGYDTRGTIYAVYTFSRDFLGVPPLWYFSSWVPQTIPAVTVPAGYDNLISSPQVRFRAWFPNDTDMFTPWRKLNRDNNEKYLETMLRLKMNTIEMESSVDYPGISPQARLVSSYGLVVTSHHHSPLNTTIGKWADYWRNIRGMEPPELLISNIEGLKDFWRYSIETVRDNNLENLWLIAFRGNGDRPFWSDFADAPESEQERAEVINRMMETQLEPIKEITGDSKPYVRMTFYDEVSDLLANGLLTPPTGENMVWTYVAARRDHYPYADLVNHDPTKGVKLGYYFNYQFTSTGSHLAQAEGPWKMEFNFRYVNSRSPLYFSVVNAGNVREHVTELSANAAMMWDMDLYDSDRFLREFCAIYFGDEFSDEIFSIYRDYYNAYWRQKESDIEGLERQYIFHDMRHARAIEHIADRFSDYSPNPLREIGFERVPGRTFRIEGSNQVDSILSGMSRAIPRFEDVERRCGEVYGRIPEQYRQFFYDNLYSQAAFMANLSKCLYHYVYAYKHQQERDLCYENLSLAENYMIDARHALIMNQQGRFRNWYDGDVTGVKFNSLSVRQRISNIKERYRYY